MEKNLGSDVAGVDWHVSDLAEDVSKTDPDLDASVVTHLNFFDRNPGPNQQKKKQSRLQSRS